MERFKIYRLNGFFKKNKLASFYFARNLFCFFQCFVDSFPVGSLPIDFSAFWAFPELFIENLCGWGDFVGDFSFFRGFYFGVAFWAA